jgi:hypothetical protein
LKKHQEEQQNQKYQLIIRRRRKLRNKSTFRKGGAKTSNCKIYIKLILANLLHFFKDEFIIREFCSTFSKSGKGGFIIREFCSTFSKSGKGGFLLIFAPLLLKVDF